MSTQPILLALWRFRFASATIEIPILQGQGFSMSEAKRIAISASDHMYQSLQSLAKSQGVSLSRLVWAILLNKLLEPGCQQMLSQLQSDQPVEPSTETTV